MEDIDGVVFVVREKGVVGFKEPVLLWVVIGWMEWLGWGGEGEVGVKVVGDMHEGWLDWGKEGYKGNSVKSWCGGEDEESGRHDDLDINWVG